MQEALGLSQEMFNLLYEQVRVTEHAPRDRFYLLERRHGLAEIIERGAVVHALGECRESDADSDALTEEFASDALLASKLREIADGAVETILGSQREEGGFKDMLISSLILMARGEGGIGIDSEAAELESEIAAAKRTRMREAELKRKLGI